MYIKSSTCQSCCTHSAHPEVQISERARDKPESRNSPSHCKLPINLAQTHTHTGLQSLHAYTLTHTAILFPAHTHTHTHRHSHTHTHTTPTAQLSPTYR